MSDTRDGAARQKGASKTARIPIKVVPAERLKKPDWIRVRLGDGERFQEVKRILRSQRLHTVCEEATCPNIGECFGKGTATFMILGDLCTRRCPFCDVAHGRPKPPDPDEPAHLADTIAALGNLGDWRAMPALETILHDHTEEDYFRADSLEAIALIDKDLGRHFAKQYADSDTPYLARASRNILSGGKDYPLYRRSFFDALYRGRE